MRVFYSHAMKLYGTPEEEEESSWIRVRFPGWELVDPGAEPERDPAYYLSQVDSCDSLVFSRYFGNITEGVRAEIQRALSNGKPVYELRGGRFLSFSGPVADLPLRERLLLRAKGALGLR